MKTSQSALAFEVTGVFRIWINYTRMHAATWNSSATTFSCARGTDKTKEKTKSSDFNSCHTLQFKRDISANTWSKKKKPKNITRAPYIWRAFKTFIKNI